MAGQETWRRIVTFNPGAIIDDDGTFYLPERAVSSLAPLYSHVGLLKSQDGVDFSLAHPEPVFDAAMLGTRTVRSKIRAS